MHNVGAARDRRGKQRRRVDRERGRPGELVASLKYVAGTTTLNLSVFEVSTALSIRSACANVVAKLQSTTLHTIKGRYYRATAVSATTCWQRQNDIVGKNTFAYVYSFKHALHAQAPSFCAIPSGLLVCAIVAKGDELPMKFYARTLLSNPYSPKCVEG